MSFAVRSAHSTAAVSSAASFNRACHAARATSRPAVRTSVICGNLSDRGNNPTFTRSPIVAVVARAAGLCWRRVELQHGSIESGSPPSASLIQPRPDNCGRQAACSAAEALFSPDRRLVSDLARAPRRSWLSTNRIHPWVVSHRC